MDKELIDRLWKEAVDTTNAMTRANIPKFAALIAEECAKVCEGLDDAECDTGYGHDKHDCAEAIRAKFEITP